MATVPYFILSPSGILALISLLRGSDPTIPTPNDFWETAKLDVIIPAYNEEKNIAMCLASLAKQTFKVRKIIIIDDHSPDNTLAFSEEFIKSSGLLNVEIIAREEQLGKTRSVYYGACSDADAIMVIDADTFLFSEDYIEILVKELYKSPGVASASGRVFPLHEKNFHSFVKENPLLDEFYKKHPEASYLSQLNWLQRFAKSITNAYRDISYLYIGHFIFKGETVAYGSIPHIVGCAAIYKRELLKAVFDKYIPTLGFNLTDAEDTFIGFSFIDAGYRNVFAYDVTARTQEPLLNKLPKQHLKWSSGFLQSCYYLSHIVKSPFKQLKLLSKKHKPPKDIAEKRQIQEPYRQVWGEEYTKVFGRPISWYLFTAVIEKISFPIFIAIILLFGHWEAILYTLLAETILVSLIVVVNTKPGKKLAYFIKTILVTPIRYALFLFDIAVLLKFIFDLLFNKKRNWRK